MWCLLKLMADFVTRTKRTMKVKHPDYGEIWKFFASFVAYACHKCGSSSETAGFYQEQLSILQAKYDEL